MALQWELVDDPALGGHPWRSATLMASRGEFNGWRFTSPEGQVWYVETPRGILRVSDGVRATLIVKALGLAEEMGPFVAADVVIAKEVKPREGHRVLISELIVAKELAKRTAAVIASAVCLYLDDNISKPEGVLFHNVAELEGGLLVA